jgi:hypothetical protein
MVRKFRNIVSLLLLSLFLIPSIFKHEHQHENVGCKTKNESHYPNLHEKCVLCNFEFSAFLSWRSEINFQRDNPLYYFCSTYDSVNISNLSQFSFLLRAPPIITIIA